MFMTARLFSTVFASMLAVSIGTGGLAHAAGSHDHSPKHGGIVTEANDLDFELVARPDVMTLHVRDHGKALSTQGGTARLTLLNGTEKTEVALAPTGDSRFEAKGAFKVASGTKAAVVVTLTGRKPVSVRFAVK